MKITLLDALEGGELGAALRQALTSETLLADHRLREERFAPCQGCFECWVKHPGTCKAKDAANDVMRDAMAADVLLWATRVRFGCWDPIAKVAFDKAVGVLSPFFRAIAGETHHAKLLSSCCVFCAPLPTPWWQGSRLAIPRGAPRRHRQTTAARESLLLAFEGFARSQSVLSRHRARGRVLG